MMEALGSPLFHDYCKVLPHPLAATQTGSAAPLSPAYTGQTPQLTLGAAVM